MALTDSNRNAIASKKVSGKAHTQQNFATTEEGISSNISIASSTIFGESINPIPATAGLTALYATDGILEKIRFQLEIIPDTAVGTNQSQGYRLKLPSDYSTNGALKATFASDTALHTALGKLQIVPSVYGTLKPDGTTELDPVLYQTNGSTVIPKFDTIDWNLDPYNGVLFIQDPPSGYDVSALRPGFLEAYLYVGSYLDTRIEEMIASGSSEPAGPDKSIQFNNLGDLSGKTTFIFNPTSNAVTLGSRIGTVGQTGLVIGTGSTLSGSRGAAIGDAHDVTAQNGFAVGSNNTVNGAYAAAFNRYTQANGISSFAGGQGISTRKILATGLASFNFSFNTALQNISHGANADYSVILGGVNNNIGVGNDGAVILGGDTVKLTGTNYTYTTVVSKLAIFGTITGGTNADLVLTLDQATKKVRSRTFNEFSLALSAAKGPTGAIQYNLGSGAFSGDTEFLFEPISKSLTLGSRSGTYGLRSFTQGNSTEAGGADSAAFNNNTTANGIAAFAAGLNTSAEGNYSHAEGANSYAMGEASHVEGSANTAEGAYSHAQNEYTHAFGRASHAGGQGDITRLVIASGIGSFNHSFNNTDQEAGGGALANYSAILGGKNNNIPVGHTGATIIGGEGIQLTGTTGYSFTTTVQNLAIWATPAHGTTGDTVLVYNPATKKVRTVPQQYIGSGSTAIITASNGLHKANFDIRLGGSVTADTVVTAGSAYSLTWGGTTNEDSFQNFKVYAHSGITLTTRELKFISVVQTGSTATHSEEFSGNTLSSNQKFKAGTHALYVSTADSTTLNYFKSSIDTNPNDAFDLSIKREAYAQVTGTPTLEKISKVDLVTDQVLIGRYNELTNAKSELNLNSTSSKLTFSGDTLSVLELTSISDGSGGNTGVVQTSNPFLIGTTHVVKLGTGSGLINGTDNTVSATTLHSVFASGEKVRIIAIGATAFGRGTRANGQFSLVGGYYDVASANTDKAPLAGGLGSFAFYSTNNDQTDNHGALATASAILGGYNHHIATGNTGATIIGGNSIKLTGATYADYTAVDNLAIWTSPETGTSGDTVLVYNSATKKVKSVAQSTIQGSGGVGSQFYTGASPSNTTVGGLVSGSVLSGKTLSQLLESMLISYLTPAFSSFSITSQNNTIEVGTALSGNKTFTWATTNSTNILSNSVAIRDVTTNTRIASGLANDGSELVDIGVITNTAPMSHSWRAEFTQQNNPSGNITGTSTNFTVNSIYPYFYGKVSSGGAAAGVNRPTANNALITGGTKVVASSNGTITITFNSTADDYSWFAIPSTSTSKTVWYVDALNNGTIGGSVSPGGNLFPANDVVSVTTVLWAGVSYKVYITNYQSAITAMEMRNS